MGLFPSLFGGGTGRGGEARKRVDTGEKRKKEGRRGDTEEHGNGVDTVGHEWVWRK